MFLYFVAASDRRGFMWLFALLKSGHTRACTFHEIQKDTKELLRDVALFKSARSLRCLFDWEKGHCDAHKPQRKFPCECNFPNKNPFYEFWITLNNLRYKLHLNFCLIEILILLQLNLHTCSVDLALLINLL